MNLKALITTLVLGTSSVALAQPVSFGASAQVDARFGYTPSGPAIRDHRPAEPMRPVAEPLRPVYAPPVVQQIDDCSNLSVLANGSTYTGPVGYASQWNRGWITLTQPTKIIHGLTQIPVGRDHGKFREIQIVADSGATNVTTVAIGFTDGTYQFVSVERTLDPNCAPVTISLNSAARGRTIQRIVVNGSSNFGARYSVRAA